MLRDIMQYDFKMRTIRSGAECEACLRQLRDEGIQVIAGDMISVTCAQKLGMNGLLILSGIESVEAAIDSAVEIYRHDAAAELLEQACALMAQAKSCHDELETYYRAAVDFTKVDEAAKECAGLFGLE